jgi:nucleotide-binding universal stress UspA family protein
MFSNILFPADGSESSNKALQYVIDFARKFNCRVVVLYSHDIPSVNYSPYYVPNPELLEELLESSKKFVKETRDVFEKAGIKAKSILIRGIPGEKIIEAAESENCDLIIMGSRGLSTVKRLLLGSVSNYVIHHTKKPVLIIE